MPLLALCTRNELSEVLHHSEASTVLRNAARELLERLPPLRASEARGQTLQ
jgi:hypothetical protein